MLPCGCKSHQRRTSPHLVKDHNGMILAVCHSDDALKYYTAYFGPKEKPTEEVKNDPDHYS